jgi:ABC-2 type transport system permease protein
LPPFVRQVSLFNPMFYMIDAFRYSFTGHSDVSVPLSVAIVAALTCAALGTALRMTALGVKLRM